MPEPPAAPAPTPAAPARLTPIQRIHGIERAIESMRPTLVADRGDVELIDVRERQVYVKMTGACTDCSMAGLTLNALQQKITETLGEFMQVIPLNPRQLEELGR